MFFIVVVEFISNMDPAINRTPGFICPLRCFPSIFTADLFYLFSILSWEHTSSEEHQRGCLMKCYQIPLIQKSCGRPLFFVRCVRIKLCGRASDPVTLQCTSHQEIENCLLNWNSEHKKLLCPAKRKRKGVFICH